MVCGDKKHMPVRGSWRNAQYYDELSSMSHQRKANVVGEKTLYLDRMAWVYAPCSITWPALISGCKLSRLEHHSGSWSPLIMPARTALHVSLCCVSANFSSIVFAWCMYGACLIHFTGWIATYLKIQILSGLNTCLTSIDHCRENGTLLPVPNHSTLNHAYLCRCVLHITAQQRFMQLYYLSWLHVGQR